MITPGGFAATALILVSSEGLVLWMTNLGRYDQIYGQVGAIAILMLWLYVTGLIVLLGVKTNAVLARMTEERKDTKIVQPQGSGNQSGTRPKNTAA